jgi:3-hydroxyisobutyrate dehydrogenase-like beta-hydroxyacid dehydrogenase
VLTIGIISPGELGVAISAQLVRCGYRVIATVDGRSDRTASRARDAGIRTLATTADVIDQADILLSCVAPAAALSVAQDAAAIAARADRHPLYIDANSVAPATLAAIHAELDACRVELVDLTIGGPASRLTDLSVAYVSGVRAREVAAIFERFMPVCDLGEAPGSASALKMLVGGMSKGLVALMLELGVGADTAGLTEPFLDACRQFYPGLMDTYARTMPTYRQHAARRADEVAEIDRWLVEIGMQPRLVRGARDLLAALAASPACAPPAPPISTIEDLIRVARAGSVCTPPKPSPGGTP